MKTNLIVVLLAVFGLSLSVVFAADTANQNDDPAQLLEEEDHFGTLLVDRPARILEETDASFSKTLRDQRRESGSTLRCWQEGRLLYEGSGFGKITASDQSVLTLSRKKGEDVSIINLQEGLCILSGR